MQNLPQLEMLTLNAAANNTWIRLSVVSFPLPFLATPSVMDDIEID